MTGLQAFGADFAGQPFIKRPPVFDADFVAPFDIEQRIERHFAAAPVRERHDDAISVVITYQLFKVVSDTDDAGVD